MRFGVDHRRLNAVKFRASYRLARMDIILSSTKWQSGLVYLDDIVVVSNNANRHEAHIRQVLTVPQDARVALRLKKCSLFAKRIT